MSDAQSTVEATEGRILAVAADITRVLAEDVGQYPDRELQRRFMADPERADAIADKDLKRLREEARSLAVELADTLRATLSERSPWLSMADTEAELPGGKDLQLIAPVWDALSFIDSGFEKLAGRYRLPDDRPTPGYQPPKRFVQRLYLPTLVETCLRELRALQTQRQQLAEETAVAKKKDLSARWAAAAPKE